MLADKLAEAAAVACGGRVTIRGGDGERENQPGDGDGGDQNQDQDQDQDKNNGEPDNSESDDDDDGDGSDDKDSGKPTIEDQLDAERRKNIALKGRITKLEQAKQKADGDKEAAAERDELKTENDKLKSVINTKFLDWAIKTNDKYKWVDSDDVASAIDRESINIDFETGEIDGLDLELKRIAKKKPHWLKKDEDDEQDNSRQGPSGFHPHGGKVKQSEIDNKVLGEKYKIPGFGSQAIRPV